jgi:hypothetical protein
MAHLMIQWLAHRENHRIHPQGLQQLDQGLWVRAFPAGDDKGGAKFLERRRDLF